jgi:hypothetical protein
MTALDGHWLEKLHPENASLVSQRTKSFQFPRLLVCHHAIAHNGGLRRRRAIDMNFCRERDSNGQDPDAIGEGVRDRVS